MMICIIELGTGLLACSLATLRPLLASLIDITAPSRYTLSNIISKSQHKENNDTTTSRTLKKQQNNDLSSLQNKTGDLESGEDNELQVFEPKSATFLAKERGRSEGSDVSLVYTK
jgi:hypothetical protein